MCIHGDFSSRPDLLSTSAIKPSRKESACGSLLCRHTRLAQERTKLLLLHFSRLSLIRPRHMNVPKPRRKKKRPDQLKESRQILYSPASSFLFLSVKQLSASIAVLLTSLPASIMSFVLVCFFCFFNPLGCKGVRKR